MKLVFAVIASATFASAGVAAASTTPPPSPPQPGSTVTLSELADAAASGYAALISGLGDVTYEDEDSLKIGDCPLITVEQFDATMAAGGLAGPFDNEAGGELEIDEEPAEGDTLDPIGVFCDFDVEDEAVESVESAIVGVLDATDTATLEQLESVLDVAESSPAPAELGGELFLACEEDEVDEVVECFQFWVSDALVVALGAELVQPADEAALTATFTEMLPIVLQHLASGDLAA